MPNKDVVVKRIIGHFQNRGEFMLNDVYEFLLECNYRQVPNRFQLARLLNKNENIIKLPYRNQKAVWMIKENGGSEEYTPDSYDLVQTSAKIPRDLHEWAREHVTISKVLRKALIKEKQDWELFQKIKNGEIKIES